MFSEKELRIMLKEAGVKMVKTGLVQGTWGNISVRIDENKMLVSPSGLDYERLTPDDMVVVDINTLEYTSSIKPTSEKKIHAAVYKQRPEINAVIHSHPVNCSVVGAARVNMPVMNEQMQKYVGGDVKIGKYGLPSTKKLTKATIEALQGRNACIMANHGVMACGESLDAALETCRIMEESAKQFIAKKAMEKMNSTENSDDLCIKYFYKINNVK